MVAAEGTEPPPAAAAARNVERKVRAYIIVWDDQPTKKVTKGVYQHPSVPHCSVAKPSPMHAHCIQWVFERILKQIVGVQASQQDKPTDVLISNIQWHLKGKHFLIVVTT